MNERGTRGKGATLILGSAGVAPFLPCKGITSK